MIRAFAILTIAAFLIAQVSATYHTSLDVDASVNTNTGVGDVIQTDIETDANISAQTGISDERENRSNNSRIFRLSNGADFDVKVMPEVASSIAIERLGLRVCSTDNNCTIVLKEVGNNRSSEVRAAYRVQVEKEARVFGIFKKKMQVTADIDAETGQVIAVNKPWWAGLATETDVAASASGSAAYK